MWLGLQNATTLAEVLDALPELLAEAGLACQSCVVYLTEGGSPVRALSLSPHAAIPGCLEPVVKLAWEETRPMLVERVLKPPPTQREFRDELSVMAVPLVAAGDCLGILYLGARRANTYGEKDFARLQGLAAPYSAFLQAVRQQPTLNLLKFELDALKNEQQATLERLHILLQDLERAQGPMHCLTAATTCLHRAIPGTTSALALLLDPPLQSLVSPYPEEFAEVSTERGLLARAARHGSILVKDVYHLIERERSAIAAPLVSDQVLQGFLYLGSPQPGSFSEGHRQLTSMIAVVTAHALQALSLAEELRAGWMTDLVTGVFSHRCFLQRLGEELAACRRTGEPLWLALLDVDRFGKYNYEQGHPSGDRLLRRLAEVVGGELPTEALLARHGGDEFVLALRGQNKAEGAAWGERLRVLCQQELAPLTVSLGVAGVPENGMRAAELLQAAEQALFNSKAAGRNRVTLAG